VGGSTRLFCWGNPFDRQAALTTTVADIIRLLERFAPPALAETWDNVGLQVGHPARTASSVWVALDPAPGVIRAACDARVDLLVVHHPLIFKPLQRVDGASAVGGSILDAAAHGLSIYVMHTNFDAAPGGLNDILGKRLGLTHLQPLGVHANGVGRCGRVKPTRVRELAATVKQRMGIDRVRVVGDPSLPVKRVALVTGSGGSLLPVFLQSSAQVFITGDLRYHDAREIEWAGKAAIDIGHFHSEHVMAEAVAGRLRRLLERRRPCVRVAACTVEDDPFIVL
jgi:dinuclear metal center YbgI/SA1388 family protein